TVPFVGAQYRGEGHELTPASQELTRAHATRQRVHRRRVPPDVAVLQAVAGESRTEQTGERAAQAVVLVPRDGLVTQPEEPRVAWAACVAGTEERDEVLGPPSESAGQPLAQAPVEARPRLWVAVVPLVSRAVRQQRFERQTLPEVRHPSVSPCLRQLLGQRLQVPLDRVVVAEVDQPRLEVSLIRHIDVAGAGGDETSLLLGMGEEVGPAAGSEAHLGQEGIEVDERREVLLAEPTHEVGPVGIPVGVELPVPPERSEEHTSEL